MSWWPIQRRRSRRTRYRDAMRLVLEHLPGADGSALFTRLSVTGAAAHSAFELGCGAGIPLMALVGPHGAAASWAAATVHVWRSSWPAGGGDKARSFLNGVSVAGVATHYIAWPFRFAA